MSERTVRAAGGVVLRDRGKGREVLLVHRPKYDDWSFPKGKLTRRERLADAALREVEEETGLRCRLEEKLGRVRYRDRLGRDKVVTYWRMKPDGGRFRRNREVDRVRWLSLRRAKSALTYDHDRELLGKLGDHG